MRTKILVSLALICASHLKAQYSTTQYITVDKAGSYRVALNGQSHGYIIGANDLSQDKFLIHSNGNSYFNGGNVGIGTPSPSSKFVVSGIDNYSDGISIENSSAYKHLITGYFDGNAPTTNSGLQFKVSNNNSGGNTAVMTLKGNGRVGIGIPTPSYTLHVNNANGQATQLLSSGIGYGGQLNFERFGSTGNYFTLETGAGANDDMRLFSNGNWSTPIICYKQDGTVGIGTTSPDATLAVKGDIHTKEVRVDVTGAMGPDYVFEKNYDLTSLKDLENYINQNKHLPEVPSAKEMEANGINLKEMNLLLLKKVEELTLHLIKQEKEVEDLKNKLNEFTNNKK